MTEGRRLLPTQQQGMWPSRWAEMRANNYFTSKLPGQRRKAHRNQSSFQPPGRRDPGWGDPGRGDPGRPRQSRLRRPGGLSLRSPVSAADLQGIPVKWRPDCSLGGLLTPWQMAGCLRWRQLCPKTLTLVAGKVYTRGGDMCCM